jgi:hypothetical protein
VPTKKQVRRRQKERRHEWEEVYVDAEGNVIDAPPDEEDAKPAARVSKRQSGARPARASGRTIQPPSWRRVLKRGLIFAPLMYITVTLLAPEGTSVATTVSQTAFLLMIFLPFSYAMDALTYRMWRRRTGESSTAEKRS